jgi:hypothetical protein
MKEYGFWKQFNSRTDKFRFIVLRFVSFQDFFNINRSSSSNKIIYICIVLNKII